MKHLIGVADVSSSYKMIRVINYNCILALPNSEQFLDHDRHHFRSKHTTYPAIKTNMGASQSTDNGTIWSLRDDDR